MAEPIRPVPKGSIVIGVAYSFDCECGRLLHLYISPPVKVTTCDRCERRYSIDTFVSELKSEGTK